MRRSLRVTASALGLTLSLAACGGGHGASVPAVPGSGSSTDSSSRATSSVTPMVSVPKTAGALAYTDAGRRSGSAPVSISVTLRYNNQAQLDQFVAAVSDPSSPSYRHFLTPEQFNSQYGPTVQQEAAVIQSLQKAGFTITQRFPNRTIVDATGRLRRSSATSRPRCTRCTKESTATASPT